MKKFEPEENFTYTPQISAQNTTKNTPKNQFDITQLLQILQKLNLSNLFKSKNKENNQINFENAPQFRQDIMQSENLKCATCSIESHREFVNKIRENQK